jgi:hypothetical protein
MQKIIDVTSIKLPCAFSEKRMLRYEKNHLNGLSLDEYDLEQYDNDTIFYDVFFDVKNQFLYTIGPPFLNLKKSLFPIFCRINNDNKKHSLLVTEYFDHKIAIGRISVKDLSLYDENLIEFNFNYQFQWSGRIELNKYEANPVILTTIQKDNRIRWIQEWIEFYSRHYDVDQTIIYDNSSCNRGDLESISSGNLLIVAWDFKYGPIRSHDNQFCQLGSLNHCRLKFGSNNIIMNFDIDELLYAEKLGLKRCIKKYNLILFNAYRVPFIKPESENYSYEDFSFRDSELQRGGMKYLYKPNKMIVNNVHSALMKRHETSLHRRLEDKYYRISEIAKKSLVNSFLLKFISEILKLKIVPVKEAYFLHYTGITNNWKSRYWNKKEETLLSDKHIKFNIPEA